MKKERSMDAKIAKVTEDFARLGGVGHTSDARRALGGLFRLRPKAMMRRGFLTKITFDTYRPCSQTRDTERP